MSQISINTTQNVNINFTLATVGQRMLSFIIDFSIQMAYIIVISFVVFDFFGLADAIVMWDDWSKMAIYILFYFPAMIYTIVLESIFEGQTLGKKIVKIKVVKIDGYQASFADYLIRWIFKLIDVYIVSGIIGIISMSVTEKGQRLGDISAGTSVITLKSDISINSTILEDIGNNYVPTYAAVIKLSDNDMRIIKDNFNIALTAKDLVLIDRLKDKIELVTGIKNQSGNSRDFINTVLKDYNFYTQNM